VGLSPEVEVSILVLIFLVFKAPFFFFLFIKLPLHGYFLALPRCFLFFSVSPPLFWMMGITSVPSRKWNYAWRDGHSSTMLIFSPDAETVPPCTLTFALLLLQVFFPSPQVWFALQFGGPPFVSHPLGGS